MAAVRSIIGVVAFCKERGLGKDNRLVWNIPEDRRHFRRLTEHGIVIMGHNTFKSLGAPLKNRLNVVFTTNIAEFSEDKSVAYVSALSELWEVLDTHAFNYPKVFVIGGTQIYKLLYEHLSEIYVTQIDKVFDTDTQFPDITGDFVMTNASKKHWSEGEECAYRFLRYVRKDKSAWACADKEYLGLARRVLSGGEVRPNRTGIDTVSCFGEQISFDISKTVPLLTTKRMAWKSCIEELLWFMRGDTDANILSGRKVKIWDGNTTRGFLDKVGLQHLEPGDCGANYSFQWRHFGQAYVDCKTKYEKNTATDQITNILRLLKEDPYSRRIFLSAWNPCDLNRTVLPPCHVSAQFYVDKDRGLSCHMYQRSCDVFLGLPFNIFSYTVLTYILAAKCDLEPRRLVISLGDTHIYTNHVDQVKTQMERVALSAPRLMLASDVKTKAIEAITVSDFELVGYFPHPSIKADMAV